MAAVASYCFPQCCGIWPSVGEETLQAAAGGKINSLSPRHQIQSLDFGSEKNCLCFGPNAKRTISCLKQQRQNCHPKHQGPFSY